MNVTHSPNLSLGVMTEPYTSHVTLGMIDGSRTDTYTNVTQSLQDFHNKTEDYTLSREEAFNRHVVALVCTVIYYVLIIPVVYGNLLVLTAICHERKLRSATHTLIASLAIADLFVGVLTLPTFSLVHYMEIGYHNREVCMLSYILSHCPTSVSCLTLLVISIERFIAIHYPFKHRRMFTRQLTIGIAITVWVYVCTFLPIIMFVDNDWDPVNAICNFASVSSSMYRNALLGHLVGVLIITTILHSKVSYTAWKSRRRIEKQLNIIRVELKIQRDAKIAKMLGMVLGIFYLCWMPYLFTIPLAAIYDEGPDPFWLHTWEQIGGIIVICNSFLNPVVYAWHNKTFRRAFQRILLLKAERVDGRLSFYQGRPSISLTNDNSLSYDTSTRSQTQTAISTIQKSAVSTIL